MNFAYRQEIDGLRAIAVTSVVLFHAKMPGFENGYLGVDIFFVISGFLITSIILSERAGPGGFSYIRFVTRRARRILPALYVVTLACVPAAFWLMLPEYLENFGQSMVATALSANNILLWLTSGYWDQASEYKPLLHTWSLGVEEQFYLVFPLILIAVLKISVRIALSIVASIGVLSILLMIIWQKLDPVASFYLLHTRAWQLLIGASCAIVKSRIGPKANVWLSALGVALLIVSLSPDAIELLQYPWIRSVISAIGAGVFLLWTDAKLPTGWVFTRRPLVVTGLASYSIYLWHQPILSFIKIGQFNDPDISMTALGVVCAYIIGWGSWRYIEMPFRSREAVSQSKFWAIAIVGSALIVTLGLSMHLSNGFPARLGNGSGYQESGSTIAFNERVRKIIPRDAPTTASRPLVVVAGNSFARDFANVIVESDIFALITLVYRDDLASCPRQWTEEDIRLVKQSTLVIFGSGTYDISCINQRSTASIAINTPIKYVGPKHFGNNLNPLIQFAPIDRHNILLSIPESVVEINNRQREALHDRYIDLLGALSEDGRRIRAADSEGMLLSTDNIHLSRRGAIHLAKRLRELVPDLYRLVEPSIEGPASP